MTHPKSTPVNSTSAEQVSDTITIPRATLQGVMGGLKRIKNLASYGGENVSPKVYETAEEALASLDAVLSEGE